MRLNLFLRLDTTEINTQLATEITVQLFPEPSPQEHDELLTPSDHISKVYKDDTLLATTDIS